MRQGSPSSLVDTKLTEAFLMGQQDVLNASAWFEAGELRACVSVASDRHPSQNEMRAACSQEIGVEYTPAMILVVRAARRSM